MTATLDVTAAGFLFDMDGTLVDSTAVVEALWGRFADRHGLETAEILAFSHGRQTLDTVQHFLPRTPTPPSSSGSPARSSRRS